MVNLENNLFWDQIYPQKIKWKKCWKKFQNRYQHITMYSSAKFQSIWRKSDIPSKIEWKKNWKNECQNCDKHITMYHCHIFSSFGELQTLRRSLPPKFAWIINWKNKCQNHNRKTTVHSSTKFYFEGERKDKIHENLTF